MVLMDPRRHAGCRESQSFGNLMGMVILDLLFEAMLTNWASWFSWTIQLGFPRRGCDVHMAQSIMHFLLKNDVFMKRARTKSRLASLPKLCVSTGARKEQLELDHSYWLFL